LHCERDKNGVVTLLLGAHQGAWILGGGSDLVVQERIDRAELRAALCARGILNEL
jgi:hypothetical protein